MTLFNCSPKYWHVRKKSAPCVMCHAIHCHLSVFIPCYSCLGQAYRIHCLKKSLLHYIFYWPALSPKYICFCYLFVERESNENKM